MQIKDLIENSKYMTEDLRELYIRGLGELGIPKSEFLAMTPDEIDLAYEGYIRRQIMTVNLQKLALAQVLNNNLQPIQIMESGEYEQGSLIERESLFTELGIGGSDE